MMSGEADFLMTSLRSNFTNMFMKTDLAEQGRVWRDFPHAIKKDYSKVHLESYLDRRT